MIMGRVRVRWGWANEALNRYLAPGDAECHGVADPLHPDDLARIQVSPTLGPLAETVMAVSLLRCPDQPRALLGGCHPAYPGSGLIG